jgi:tetratricopeptide (TPR) repeat protein
MKPKALIGLQASAILAAGAWVYGPALRGGWVWDDAAEVARNPVLTDPAGLWKIWAGSSGPDYFPLKTTLQWLEWRMWGAYPFGYHLASLGLHLLCALLFWRLLVVLRPDGEGSGRPGVEWLGGLLFAVHPLAVESVAWIAEFKNTLSLALLLLAAIGYADFDRTGRRVSYGLSLLGFLLALLAKSTVVMFPAVILLHAWWRRGRIAWKDLLASAPFFALAAALGLVTVWFQGHRAIEGADLAIGGLFSRLEGAGLAVTFYLEKFLLPTGLMPIYPRWPVVPPSAIRFWPWLAIAGLGFWLWTERTKAWARGLVFGIGFFGINLLPVLGLVPMAYLRISWVADHFAYLPMLGLVGLAVGGIRILSARLPFLPLAAAVAAVVAGLACESRLRAATYLDDRTFWTAALERNPGAWLGHNDLGLVLADAGDLAGAIGQFEAAVRLNPGFAEAHNNLGNAYIRSARLSEAIGQFVSALRLEPNYVAARDNLGSALVLAGRYDEAIDQYRQVLRLKPDLAEAHGSLAYALAATGRIPEAIGEYERSVQIDPGASRVHNGLGIALAKSGRLPEAIAEFRRSIAIQPSDPEAHYDLGLALRMSGRADEAEAQFAEAARLRGGP